MGSKIILFVDDEEQILKSIERAFIGENYQIETATSVDEAIEILKNKDVDIIVTDMKMPIKGGDVLLKYAKDFYPSIPRIALSGYADESKVYRLLESNIIKHYIMKPWKNEELIGVINKVVELEEKLSNSHLLKLINNISSIPTIPEAYKRINEIIQNDGGLDDIAKEISKDPSISSKILKIANSGFYALKTDSVVQAVSFLGINIVKNVVLSNEIFKVKKEYKRYIDIIWEHIDVINNNIKALLKFYLDIPYQTMYTSAALFHDIGMAILVNEYGEKYMEILKNSTENTMLELNEKEKEILGVTHAEVGGFLLNWWEFPYHIIEATMYHHDPTNPAIINDKFVKTLYLSDMYSWGTILNKEDDVEPNLTILQDLNITKEECIKIFNDSETK